MLVERRNVKIEKKKKLRKKTKTLSMLVERRNVRLPKAESGRKGSLKPVAVYFKEISFNNIRCLLFVKKTLYCENIFFLWKEIYVDQLFSVQVQSKWQNYCLFRWSCGPWTTGTQSTRWSWTIPTLSATTLNDWREFLQPRCWFWAILALCWYLSLICVKSESAFGFNRFGLLPADGKTALEGFETETEVRQTTI